MDRTFDRVLLARHLALSLGAVAAYIFRTELAIGYVALWIVGISASLNFLAYAFRTRPGLAKLCFIASPIIGVGGWSALIAVTAGVVSPFIAGLWLEVVLSAMALQLRGIVLVTLGSVAALWGQQLWLGIQGSPMWLAMLLQSGFLVGMGLATYLVTRRWVQRQDAAALESRMLGARLDSLTRQLEDERVVSALGENVARLAHGLKNTVHSLRGFVSLIEPKLEQSGGNAAALRGLRAAIDDLESLAYLTLGSEKEAPAQPLGQRAADTDASPATDEGMMPPAVRRALDEIGTSAPGVNWETKSDGVSPILPIPEASFVETLVILLRNAVEAMDGDGNGCVETRVEDEVLHVSISDEGRGFADNDIESIFKPGHTTKPGGSGYGLFLARRIVEAHGGSIHVEVRPEGGASVEVSLPVGTASPSSEVR